MLRQNKAVKRAYSLIVFLGTLRHWVWHWMKANKNHFGWQFRYLTQWALTMSMLFHMCTLLYRCMWRGQPTDRKSAYMLAVSVCVVNMLVFVLYWPAFFLQPGLIGTLVMSLSQDVFVHAISPLSVFFDAMLWSRPFKKQYYRSSQACTFAICLSYVFWLEALVAPFGKIPYAFLRVAPWTHRCLCYVVSSLIGLTLHRIFFFGLPEFTAGLRSKPRALEASDIQSAAGSDLPKAFETLSVASPVGDSKKSRSTSQVELASENRTCDL